MLSCEPLEQLPLSEQTFSFQSRVKEITTIEMMIEGRVGQGLSSNSSALNFLMIFSFLLKKRRWGQATKSWFAVCKIH